MSEPPPVPPNSKSRDIGGENGKLRFDSRDIALTSVFASLYVVINVVQSNTIGNPTIYGPIQLRIADCLIPLAALFGIPVIAGLSMGCFISNFIYFLGTQDVVFGTIANLIAATVVFLLRKHRLFACFIGALPIGFIVGAELAIFFSFMPPENFILLGSVGGMILSVTLSSFITITLIGYTLLKALGRRNVIKPLESHGLKSAVE